MISSLSMQINDIVKCNDIIMLYIDLCVLLHRSNMAFIKKDTFPLLLTSSFTSSHLTTLPCQCTWLYLRLTYLPYVISKPLSARSWMGTKERPPLMINCSKSPGFCIPMVPGLSGHHVTCSQHFSSRLGESYRANTGALEQRCRRCQGQPQTRAAMPG